MKKTYLSVLAVSVILASCTMPWAKTKTDTAEEVIPADEMNVSGEVPAKTNETISTTSLPDTTDTTTNTAVQKDITPSDTPKAIAEGGVYLPYTSTAVAQAKGSVVLFFHASWCPTCVAINKDIEAHLKDIPKNVTILKVNYDEAAHLKELYEVTGQYSFVQVDNSGKLIKKWRGGSTLNEVLGQIQKSETDTSTQDIPAPETKKADLKKNVTQGTADPE